MGRPLQVLGERIRDLRKARGWSQERFADICGVHRTYMGHLERGEKNVSFNTLSRLADALGISLAELVSHEGKSPSKKSLATRKAVPPAATNTGDIEGVIRELDRRRMALEETAGVLKDLSEALRIHDRRAGKRGKQ